MSKYTFSWLVSSLLISWLVSGVIASLAGFFGFITVELSLLIVLPSFFFLCLIQYGLIHFSQLKFSEKALSIILAGVWLVHFSGVLVPETSFDAVWYHLPVVKAFTEAGKFVYLPELYQSANPLFSDMIFLLGYQLAEEQGAKLVAFGFGLTLVLISYQLARTYLDRFWSLVTVLIVSSFQVVTWQSSSFYIDIPKAVWELAAIWFLVRHDSKQFVAGMFFGASLASKLFSVALTPVFLIITAVTTKTNKAASVVLFLAGAATISSLFYLRTVYYTGWSLISGQFFISSIPDIGGSQQVFNYLLQRTVLFPSALFTLTFGIRDYVTLLFLVCLPFLVHNLRNLATHADTRSLLLLGLAQFLVWWFLPPLSTRYALSGFVVLLIVYVICIKKWISRYPHYLVPLLLTIFLSVAINLAPRAIVLKRNMDYMQHQPPLAEYIPQFYDGWIDTPLKRWYQLP